MYFLYLCIDMEYKLKSFAEKLKKRSIDVAFGEKIAPYTTFKIGGPADILIKVKNSTELEIALEECAKYELQVFLIGKGSNILVSDKGVRGVTIINQSTQWDILEDVVISIPDNKKTESRYFHLEHKKDKYKIFKGKTTIVRVDSGVSVGTLRNNLFKSNIFGLEWFAGIPSTTGGALYVNMHGANVFFGDLVYRAKLFDGKEFKIVQNDYFKFAYDYSFLQETKESIIWIELLLQKGDVSEPMQSAKEWAKQKSFQPQRSAGCIFHNLSEKEMSMVNSPTPSAGYLIDKILGLKGLSIGGAKVSEKHAAFIENTGNAKAEDVLKIIDIIKNEAKTKLELNLKLEIELKGDF